MPAKIVSDVRAGRKVSAEVVLTPEVLEKYVHATPRQLIDYWRMSAIGGVLSGTMGVHGHFANGLAALYIATGQDAACVAESAMGVTRFEETAEGNLYASVTLPGVMVGRISIRNFRTRTASIYMDQRPTATTDSRFS